MELGFSALVDCGLPVILLCAFSGGTGGIVDRPAQSGLLPYRLFVGVPSRERSRRVAAFPPSRVQLCSWLVLIGITVVSADLMSREGEDVPVDVVVVVVCDNDRWGRGERSRASDACEVHMRFLVWTECILYAEAMSEAAVNPSSLSLGNLRGRDRSNCNVSVPVMYSLICVISVSLATAKTFIPVYMR